MAIDLDSEQKEEKEKIPSTLHDTFIRQELLTNTRKELTDEGAKGLCLRVTNKGHKSFVFRYRFGEKVKRYTIGSYPAVGLAKARKLSKELSYKVSNGIDPLIEKQKNREPIKEYSFTELAERYCKRHLPELREKTRIEYLRIINKELIPTFKKYSAKEITRKQIVDLLDGIAIDRNAPVLSNRVRAILSSIFSFGIDKAILDANPVLMIKRRKKTKDGETVEKKRKRVYSPDELKLIWNAFSIQSEPVRSLLFILTLCAQRKGETRSMKWNDIDFKNRVWTIPARQTKAKREQVVPLSEQAFNILIELQKDAGNSEYVFPNRTHDDKPIEWLQKASDRVKKLAVDDDKGINVADFRIHDLRRTGATYMAELGTDRTVLGKVLNHKELSGDNQVTAIYDRHDYLDSKRMALQKWADQLEAILTGKKAKILKIG